MATESLKTIETQISRLQARAQALRQKQRQPAIAAIVQQMKTHDISTDEIAQALEKSSGKRRTPAAKQPASTGRAKKSTVAPKYRHPETGATWSGRGRSPRWLVEAEQSGADRESFRI